MSPESQFDLSAANGAEFASGSIRPIVPSPAAGIAGSTTATAMEMMPKAWTPPPPRPSAVVGGYHRLNDWVGGVIKRFTLPGDAGPVDPFGKMVSTAPPWFISLIVHFSIMILLGLLVLGAHEVASRTEKPIEVDLAPQKEKDEVWTEKIGKQLDDPKQTFSQDGPDLGKDAISAIASSDLPEVKDPLIGPPVLDPTPNGTLPMGTVNTPAIGLELSGREEGQKKALLQAYGGTKLTEDSVKEALAWLARQQKSKGSWSMMGPYKDASRVENEEAATAMALLAFQAAGHTPHSSDKGDPYTKIVTRGWKFLSQREQKDGHFFGNTTAEQQQLYTQAMCTIAICELFGMTRDEDFHEPAQRAVDYCVKIQAPEGGWRYDPGVDSDMSVTGWFSMALQSARMAGLEVPSPTLDRLSKFLDSVQREDGSRYAYQLQAGSTLPLTAEGLLCRQYLGWKHDDGRLRAGVDYILTHLPKWDERNVYYWYYATQVCHHMEGQDWQKWNGVMRQLLPSNQEKHGPERGSWAPGGDRWGDAGGRLYVTCLSTYTLEVYYRHLPIYRHTLNGNE